MQSTALLGALTLLPYMGGPDSGGLLKPKLYYRRSIGIAFAWIWCIFGVGVPCLMSKCPLLHRIARILVRIGMLATTLLVIFYCQWSLAPDWTGLSFWVLVGAAVAVHAIPFGLACYDRDL